MELEQYYRIYTFRAAQARDLNRKLIHHGDGQSINACQRALPGARARRASLAAASDRLSARPAASGQCLGDTNWLLARGFWITFRPLTGGRPAGRAGSGKRPVGLRAGEQVSR